MGHIGDDHDVRGRVRDSGSPPAIQPQSDQAQRLGRVLDEIPAGKTDDSPLAQAVVICQKSFAGVKAVLRKSKGSRRRGGPGIDEGSLDQIELLVAAGQISAGVLDFYAHAGMIVHPPGIVSKAVLRGIDNCRIEFYPRHFSRAEEQGRQHIAAASGANDEHLWLRQHVVGQRGQIVAQKINCGPIVIPFLDRRARFGIDQYHQVAGVWTFIS